MGLLIQSTAAEYDYSYSALHHIRYMAYRAVGGTLNYHDWHDVYAHEDRSNKEYVESLRKYPNIIWHSDCDGVYTTDGAVEDLDNPKMGLQSGNSVELLRELRDVRETVLESRDSAVTVSDWQVFDDFYNVVQDIVENGDGRIEFR